MKKLANSEVTLIGVVLYILAIAPGFSDFFDVLLISFMGYLIYLDWHKNNKKKIRTIVAILCLMFVARTFI